jgi:hypothetical protein
MSTESIHEIDISGRLERVDHHTYLAIGGPNYNFVAKLSIEQKARLWPMLKEIDMRRAAAGRRSKKKKAKSPEEHRQRTFAIMCYYLLRDAPGRVDYVVIDQDYPPKKFRSERDFIKRLLKQNDAGPSHLSLTIGKAGKGMAHDVAAAAFKGGEVGIDITAEMIAEYY